MSQPVVLKSNPHGINLILDDRIPFQELLDEILHKFKESDKFFKNARIALSFEGRELSQEEELAIVDLISRNTSIDVVCILLTVKSLTGEGRCIRHEVIVTNKR